MSEYGTEALALGIVFRVDLAALLSSNKSPYTVEQLITALEATTTLQELAVDFGCSFNPTAENNRRIVAPLYRCIANLRHQNKQHPLKKLELCWRQQNDGENRMRADVLEQFLVAAKRFGISHMTLLVYIPIPIQFLLDFCRENSHLRVLEMAIVHFLDSTATVALPPNDRLQGAFVNFEVGVVRQYSISCQFW
jgi:hypothetical protein